ncbi:MAG TPA: hypothetical protein VFF76_07265 [Holophagaceae bacterium]|nr:hypothetical protein [Holophagaceae bacterium]
MLTGPKAERQRQRQREGIAIAKGLSGAAVLNYRLATLEGRPALVDKETGEVIEAGPGEGRALRFAMMHLLGADAANHAVGVVKEVHEDGREQLHEEAAAQTRHSSRLNTNYIEAMRRRNRKNATFRSTRTRPALSAALSHPSSFSVFLGLLGFHDRDATGRVH